MTIKNDLLIIKQNFNINRYSLKEFYADDEIKLKTEFNLFVDSLSRCNIISQKTAQNVYLSKNKRNEVVINCLSYTMRID